MPLRAVLAFVLGTLGPLAAGTPPSWVQRLGAAEGTYPAAQYLTGYGVSQPGASEADQRRQAQAMAREELAASLRVQVRSEFTSSKRVTSQGSQAYLNSLVQTQSDLDLEGLDRFEVYQDAKTGLTHCLVILDKARAAALLEERLRGRAQELRRSFPGTGKELEALLRTRAGLKQVAEGLALHRILRPGSPLALDLPALDEVDRAARSLLEARPGFEGALDGAIYTLGTALPGGLRVMIDRIVYGDTRFASSFSAYLEQRLSDRLGRFDGIRLLDKARQEASPLKAQALLHGSYLELGDEVSLQLKATSLQGEELASAQVKLPKAQLAQAGLRLLPENHAEATKRLEILEGEVKTTALQVRLRLDRGDGAVYRNGEALHFYLKANRDCYVRVLYQQVDGSLVQVFPNPFHPEGRLKQDTTTQVPAEGDGFELRISEPFGSELLKVYASTEAFPLNSATTAPSPGPFERVEGGVQAMNARFRGITLKKAEALTAEATAVINTVALPRP